MRSPQLNYNDNDTEEQYHWNHFQKDFFFPVDKWLKTLTANQNPFDFKELDLKWQMKKLQHALIINRTLSSVGVDANLVIATVIVFGMNGPLE